MISQGSLPAYFFQMAKKNFAPPTRFCALFQKEDREQLGDRPIPRNLHGRATP